MIRVLNIQETIGSGGVERRRLSLAKYLDKKRFELKIVCTFEKGELPNEIREQGVEVIPIGGLKGPFHWRQHKKVQKIIQEFKPHIVHGAVFEGVTMAAINGFLKRVPVVIIEETSAPLTRSWRGNLLMKMFSKVADKVIGVSPASVEYLKNTLHLGENKVELVKNGVAKPRAVKDEEKAKVRAMWGIADGDVVFGSVGRMLSDKNKRFSDLIKAFAKIATRYNNVRLLLVGDGPEREQYKRLCKDLNIEEKVILTGYQHDVALFYSCMDVFALVSAYESFGLVLAEAMLHKLPVVATRVGGMQYIVEHTKTGFLVEKYNVKQIVEKLESLYIDPALRMTMGEGGYQKAIEQYTEEQYVGRVIELYNSLLESKRISLVS